MKLKLLYLLPLALLACGEKAEEKSKDEKSETKNEKVEEKDFDRPILTENEINRIINKWNLK